jgi:hypothetical protein
MSRSGVSDPFRSFREMLAALDFRATFELARNELKVRATLAPEFLPLSENGTSSLLSVPPARTERKGRHPSAAFVHLVATYRLRNCEGRRSGGQGGKRLGSR